MPTALRSLSLTLNASALLLVVGCGDAATSPSDPGPIALTIVSGNTQSGVVGLELPTPLVVKATNAKGNPIEGLTVDFRVTSGGGSMYVVASSTNNNGKAQNYWTLGTSTAEPQRVEVRTVLSDGTKQVLGVFNATALAGPAARIEGGGFEQTALRGTRVLISPSVHVRDQYENFVPNLTVTFAVTSGGGTVLGANAVTDAQGIATVGSWTLGAPLGQNTLTATVLGSAVEGNPVTFAARSSNWDMKSSLPSERRNHGVAVVNGVLYAVGGYGQFGELGSVDAYDPGTNTWSTKTPMPTPREYLGAATVDGVLYAIGGSESDVGLGTVEAYDVVADRWTTKAQMPTPRRRGFGVAALNGLIYSVGGVNSVGNATGAVEVYDPLTNSWSTKAPMPTPRYGFGVAVVNGVLYAVGGYGPEGVSGTVEAYHPGTNSWSTVNSMPTPRYLVSVSAVNGVIYAIGGARNTGDGGSDIVEFFDPITSAWATGDPLPESVAGTGVGVVNGILYTTGATYSSVGNVYALIP